MDVKDRNILLSVELQGLLIVKLTSSERLLHYDGSTKSSTVAIFVLSRSPMS
jgi:hypothetical protein